MGFCWIYSRRWLVLFISLLIVSIISLGAGRIVQTADYRVYFDEGDEALAASDKLSYDYSNTDNVLFVLSPGNGNVFDVNTLQAVIDLTEASWKIPYATRVNSVSNYQHSYAYDDELIIEDLVSKPESMSAEKIDAIRKVAIKEPNLINRLISDDGSVTGVNVTIKIPKDSVDSSTREIVEYARKLVDETKAMYPELDVYLTGIVLMNNAFPEATEKDSATLIPAMLLLIIAGLAFLFRSFSTVVVCTLAMLLSIASAMGVAGWLGYKLNPVSGAAPIIVLTIAIAGSVHVLISFINMYRNQNTEKHKAIQQALESNFKPILLTSVSTCIGFLSMNFSDSPPFRELGNISAAGIIAAFLLTFTFLPALLNILPVKAELDKTGQQNKYLQSLLSLVAELVIRRPKTIVIATMTTSILLGLGVFKNELNEDFIRYFDKEFDVRISTEYALDNLTGISVVEYDFSENGQGGVSEPDYLKKLDSFSQWLNQQPEVVHVNTFSDTIKRINKNMNGDDEAFYVIPDDRELIAQYILLYETSLPFGLGITDRVKLDKSASRVTVTLNDVTNNALLAFDARSQTWIDDHFPDYMRSPGLGWSMMFGSVAKNNVQSMLNATIFALLIISAFLIVPFKSVKIGALSLIPNVLPALIALGIWGILIGSIGLAASVITALTFGIVVDDSIHFLTRYVSNRRDNKMSTSDSIRDVFNTTGKAIVATSVVLIVGFLLLSTSGFKVNSIIGSLSAITLAVALVLDLLLLPSLLIVADRWIFAKETDVVFDEKMSGSSTT